MASSTSGALKLQNPIVLVHGLGAKAAYGPIDYFFGLPARLKQSGNRVFVANLTSWHTIKHRATELKRQIEEAFPDERVNIISHSMGGLDSRYLVSALGFAERVASVTTIGTPNRGTSLSDVSLGLIPAPALLAVNRVASLLSSSFEGLQQVSQRYFTETFSRSEERR